MRTKQLVAGAAVVGGAGLALVGLGLTVVTADAAPPITSNEPDPSGPTFTIEPAHSAPSPDITSDTGIASSTDTGSVMPDVSVSDLTVGAPSDLPPIVDVPIDQPPIEGITGPADMPALNAPGAQLNTIPGDPTGVPEQDLGHGCRPFWCPRPPDGPSEPPTWPWNDPFWPDTSDSWDSTTIVLPSPCVVPPQRDAPPPPPLQYGGQTVSPAFDGGMRQWGFWYFGNWVPLLGPNASRRLIPKMQSHTPSCKVDDRSCGCMGTTSPNVRWLRDSTRCFAVDSRSMPAGIYGHAAVCCSGRVMSDSRQHIGPSADCRTKSQFTLYRTVTQLRETLRSVSR